MEEATPAIELRSVVKRFGQLTAVDHLDLTVPTGICLGLLGPNGAGKSTTMRMLTAQAIATEGSISVLGYTLPQESKAARMAMGVVPQQDNLDIDLTCRQILEIFATLYRVPRPQRAAAIARALEIANLQGRADTIVRELSGGMRRWLLVARGLSTRRGWCCWTSRPSVWTRRFSPNDQHDAYDEHSERGRRLEILQRTENEFDPIPFDAEAARIFGRVTAAVVAAGRTPRRRAVDLLIAATAIAAVPLFTTSYDDYAGLEELLRVVEVTRPELPPAPQSSESGSPNRVNRS